MQALERSLVLSSVQTKIKNQPESKGVRICAVVSCVGSLFPGCALAAGTVLQRVPVAPNEEQKVPFRVGVVGVGVGGRQRRERIHS